MPELAPVTRKVLPVKSGIFSADQALPGDTAFSNIFAARDTLSLTVCSIFQDPDCAEASRIDTRQTQIVGISSRKVRKLCNLRMSYRLSCQIRYEGTAVLQCREELQDIDDVAVSLIDGDLKL